MKLHIKYHPHCPPEQEEARIMKMAAATLALLHLESKVSLARTLIVKNEEGGKMGN